MFIQFTATWLDYVTFERVCDDEVSVLDVALKRTNVPMAIVVGSIVVGFVSKIHVEMVDGQSALVVSGLVWRGMHLMRDWSVYFAKETSAMKPHLRVYAATEAAHVVIEYGDEELTQAEVLALLTDMIPKEAPRLVHRTVRRRRVRTQ
jgi:hypothetical protein